ncbi:MAG TPA: hypothetical protein VKZ18_18055 [Polyangia bacterium]|nr:hypothetical protein [Polyangia bacterium]
MLVSVLVVLGAARGVQAEPYRSSAACTRADLLTGLSPIAHVDVRGDLRLPTDGAVAPEGARWNAPVGVVLQTPAASLTYDLGEVRPVSAFVLQADANDSYKIFGAVDDEPEAFELLAQADNVVTRQGHGLRTRTVTINATPIRYLKVGEPAGDGAYAISELQAYCQAPSPFPPDLPIAAAPPATVAAPSFWRLDWWNNDASARFELGLALAALALVGWGLWLGQRGRRAHLERLRDGLLIAVGALSFGAFWNFGSYHFGNFTHQWDNFHRYIGSKYFAELSYDRLYECVAVADWQEPALRRRAELRAIKNLRTGALEGTGDILAHPKACTAHFSPERWESFRRDVGFFRARFDTRRWEEAQTDQGYTGSPVWSIAGATLASLAPASDDQITWLTRLDPLLIVGLVAMSLWAFGWRTTCVALAVFATYFPSRFYWTGGSFLRWDWFFCLVAGICLVKKDRPFAGGVLLGCAALLRIFPAFILVGPLLLIVQRLWSGRRIDRRLVMLLGGAAAAAVILVPISLKTGGGVDGYRAFARRGALQMATPLTNDMGLRTVVAYRPSEGGRVMKDDGQQDPWAAWRAQKRRTFRARLPIYLAALAAFLWLLHGAVRDTEPWVACALATTLMAVGADLCCYEYLFVFAIALLAHERREVGAILLTATAATGIIDWCPTRHLPDSAPWTTLKWSHWLDDQYTAMSVVTIVALVWILTRFRKAGVR